MYNVYRKASLVYQTRPEDKNGGNLK